MDRKTIQARCVPGAPCWVSLMARDLETAQGFYGPLLGWRFEQGPDRWGPYCRAVLDGVAVAGLGAVAASWEFPVAWTTYFGTDDADLVAARVRERTGMVVVGPLAFDAGRIALATDPQGAAFGIWQGRAGPVDDLERPGALAWSELRTSDAFAAAMFYGAVFAWDDPSRFDVRWEHDRVLLLGGGHAPGDHTSGDHAPGGDHTPGGERTLASLFGGGTEAAFDPRVRPRWHVFFAVSDADAAARQAVQLGGSVATPAEDTPYGRVIQLRDREGGLFWAVTRPH
ncbi:VOC family protein [Streptacidiphilus sp. P02-A3a]|uniref:VOC family protein n=1 Tax=Streptacidiphilus sp. P02-A3a TaxID=2704468 RepID=UPI0015FA34AB|nr:VOC family protein [Streptacidiphilus sp. P02-A3a]QMU70724.1 VOC family protein [Streptacidiphilus sp. P02-A3a]